jgi:hypothetical protein
MEGLALLRVLIQSTGLPMDAVEREVKRLLEARNLRPENITLEDVREILAFYLQDVLTEVKTSLATQD